MKDKRAERKEKHAEERLGMLKGRIGMQNGRTGKKKVGEAYETGLHTCMKARQA
jgi:hypothetical protein